MAFDSFVVEIDGEEMTDAYDDLLSLEVELSDQYPATVRFELGVAKDGDGAWTYLDEERFRVWKTVTVSAGFVETGREELFTGYVTHVAAKVDSDPSKCRLEVTGMDGSVLMDREEKLKDWPEKKDSDIAREIFGEHGLTPEVEDTEIVHEEALSTVIQRETDLQFLERLALRNGFDCHVEGTTGFFGPLPVEDDPQPVLAAHFGEETNLLRFSPKVDGLRPAAVSMFQVDRFGKEVLSAETSSSDREPLGALDPGALLGAGVPAARVYVGKNAATGTPEMEALCRGLFDEGSWFIQAEGEIDSACYEHVLRPRRLVTIKGVGETYSGVYYVPYVRHRFTCESYTQCFRVQRNALLPTGDEDFSSNGGPAGLL